MNTTDILASKFLGKRIEGSSSYDSSLLVAIPRCENRKQYNIVDNNLPFDGFDVWHAYEFSVMTENGLPVTRLMKLKYSCKSEFLVESKSLKLYLNSFNMSRFGKNIEECLDICRNLIEKDLSKVLKTDVNINFLDNKSERCEIFSEFENIIEKIEEQNIFIDKFKETPELLQTEKTVMKEYCLTFDSLRSNCRVTHQPDFGDVFVYYKSEKHIKEDSLVKYLCSFRSEYHFHEECCEMIFKRLLDVLNENDELFVCALYTRRGGIDISPVRYTPNCTFKGAESLQNLNKFARYGIKQ